jgi:hypothetical protein
MNVLAITSGGASLKFKVVEFDEPPKAHARFTLHVLHFLAIESDVRTLRRKRRVPGERSGLGSLRAGG